MRIVGVAACTVGIAHTYIAQEKLENSAIKADHEIRVETQGIALKINGPLNKSKKQIW